MKRLTLFLCAILVSGAAFSQAQLKPTVGLNVSNFSKDPASGDYKGQVGYQFGGSVMFGHKFYFEPGLLFVKKSTKFVSTDNTGDDLKSNISGLRVPVAVGLNLLGDESSTVGLRAYAGASGFFLTGVDAGNATKDDFESTSWGVFAGGGLDIAIFFVDVKYEWSLTDVSSVKNVDVGKFRSMYINAGLRFKL